MNELISIVIPVYNKQEYLEKCLDNLLSQTYKNMEIILVDDGSQDDSYQICINYEKKDNRIKVVKKTNGGPSSARNLGMNIMTGDYLVFLDADDYIDKEYIYELYYMLKNNSALMSVCEMRFVDSNNKQIWKTDYSRFNTVVKSRDEYLELIEMNWGPCCKMYDKSIIKHIRFDEKFSMAEDLLFNSNVISQNHSFNIAVLKKCLYSYVMVPNSIVHAKYDDKNIKGIQCEDIAFEVLDRIDVEDRLSKVLFGGIIGFYSRYSKLSQEEKKRFSTHGKIVQDIVIKRKKYLLQKRDRGFLERLKMKMIVCCPKVYMYIRSKC